VDKLKPHLKLHEQNKIPRELTVPPKKRSGFRGTKKKVKKEPDNNVDNTESSVFSTKACIAKKARQLGR